MSRPRGELTETQKRRLTKAASLADRAEQDRRAEVVRVLAEGASFSEVAAFTGLSTNTLQRWKREAAG